MKRLEENIPSSPD